MTGTLLDRRFQARADQLGTIRQAVAAAVEAIGCDGDTIGDVVLAVDEACQNIVRHSYGGAEGDVIVQLTLEDDRLVVRLIDFAPPVAADAIAPRPIHELQPGGLGLHFIRSVMDDIALLPPPVGAGNLLQMVKSVGVLP
jgi:sigma-B regulation protein RsbU (phosphoserine phosphatase)